MTKKHLQFCIYYMQTGDQQVAYKMTYPRAAVKSLKASASRLMARPDVAEWVNGTEERVHNRMMRQFHSEHYDEFKEKLLTINEKRTVLTKIIKGETKRVRYVKVKYGVQKVEEDLSADTVLRAIDLDTRLENFYNYLTRSDTWRKTQNIYVNTPTLQQQVNILINQTSEKEETKVVQADIETSPPGRGVGEPCAQAGWVHSRGKIAQDTPESELVEEPTPSPEQTLSPAAACPAGFGSSLSQPKVGRGDPARLSRAIRDAGTGVGHSRGTIAQDTPEGQDDLRASSCAKKKTPRYLSAKSTGLSQKKNTNRLTTVNNLKRHHEDNNNSTQGNCST